MRPSTAIMHDNCTVRDTIDSTGRKLTIRNLTALDRLRVFKAAGPDLSLNQPWIAVAALVSSVSAIDGVPVPFPTTEAQIEALVGRLGDAGLDAIAEAIESLAPPDLKEQVAIAGN